MNKFHNFIVRISTWYVWLAFLVGFMVFNIVVMGRAMERMKTSCGEAVKIPDLEIGYTGPQLQNMLEYMSVDCRAEYIRIATLTDILYPLVYGLFFFFTIVILYYRSGVPVPKGSASTFMLFPPILTIFSDYAENLSIVRILQSNHMDETWLSIASVFSMIKWFFFIASIVLILLGVIRWLINRFRKPA